MRTVEERFYLHNMPKFYGWWSIVVKVHNVPYNTREFAQFATLTNVVDGLPEVGTTERLWVP